MDERDIPRHMPLASEKAKGSTATMQRIEHIDDVKAALTALVGLDPRLEAVVDCAGDVPLRRRAPGFEGLAEIIVSQQLSKASANAIFGRMKQALPSICANSVGNASDETLRGAGLSAGKVRTLRAIVDAENSGLDLVAIGDVPAEEAMEQLTAIKGVGPWTAEVYLLFSLGHPDIFPAGDLALQIAVADALALEDRPKDKALREIASAWSPHRGVAARLFWRYYGVKMRREAVPVS